MVYRCITIVYGHVVKHVVACYDKIIERGCVKLAAVMLHIFKQEKTTLPQAVSKKQTVFFLFF